jgi:hypothetical protein
MTDTTVQQITVLNADTPAFEVRKSSFIVLALITHIIVGVCVLMLP